MSSPQEQASRNEFIKKTTEALGFPHAETRAEFDRQVTEFRRRINAGENPLDPTRVLPSADQELYRQALNVVERQLGNVFDKADQYVGDVLGRGVVAVDDLGKWIGQKLHLIEEEKNKPDYLTRKQAAHIAASRLEEEFVKAEEQAVDVEGRWKLGIWRRYYKAYEMDYDDPRFDADAFFNWAVGELQARGWSGVDSDLLKDLFKTTVETSELLQIAEGDPNLTRNELDSLKRELEKLKQKTEISNTGVSETEVLYNRMLVRYQNLEKGWLSGIDAGFKQRALQEGMLPTEANTYEQYLATLRNANSMLQSLREKGVFVASPGSLDDMTRDSLQQIYDSLHSQRHIIDNNLIPADDKIRIYHLYGYIIDELRTFLGFQDQELDDIFTPDIEWWMFEHYGRQWRDTQRLWEQYQAGNIEALSEREKERIRALKQDFVDAMNNLDHSDIAYHQRFIALDIQLNRLMTIEDAMDGVDKEVPETEQEKVMMEIYDKLRSKNPLLPPFTEIGPENSEVVVAQLTNAIMAEFVGIFNETTASGKGPIPLPGEDVNLWSGHQFGVTGTVTKKTLEFFIDVFPWQRLTKSELAHHELEHWKHIWNMRVLHIMLMHNYAAIFDSMRGEWHSKDFPRNYLNKIRGMGDKGGFSTELSGFYQTDFPATNPSDPDKAYPGIVEMIGGEQDLTWLLPQYTQYFLNEMRRHFQGYSPDTTDQVAKKRVIKEQIIADIPPEYRPDGVEPMIEVAWNVAAWRLFATLDIFDFDDDGKGSKLSRAVNVKQYGAKVLYGHSKTDDRWRDTIVQCIEHAVLPRSDYVSFLTHLEDGGEKLYEELTYDQIDQRIDALLSYNDENGNNRTVERDLKKVDDEIKILKRGIKDPNLSSAGRDRLQLALLQLERASELMKFFLEIKIQSTGPTASDLKEAVEDHYKFIQIKPEYQFFGKEGQKNPYGIGKPIALPKDYIKWARNQGDEHFVAFTEKQIAASGIHPRYVDWDTYAPSHQTVWASAMGDLINWYEFADYTDPNAIFTEIHDRKVSKLIMKRNFTDGTIPELKLLARKGLGGLEWMGQQLSFIQNGLSKLGINSAEELDKLLRERFVRIAPPSMDDLPDDMKFAKITKTSARYAFAGKLATVGPEHPVTHNIMPSGENWVKVLRREWLGGVVGGQSYDSLRDLRVENPSAADKIRHSITTSVPPYVRAAADLLFAEEPGNYDFSPFKKAESQIIIETFMIAVAAYLDQYRYESIEELKPINRTLDIDTAYSQISTIGGEDCPPMDFAHRALFLRLVHAQLEEFKGKQYGGDSSDTSAIHFYTIDSVLDMMKERGIIGTNEQWIVDMHYLNNEYLNLSTQEE